MHRKFQKYFKLNLRQICRKIWNSLGWCLVKYWRFWRNTKFFTVSSQCIGWTFTDLSAGYFMRFLYLTDICSGDHSKIYTMILDSSWYAFNAFWLASFKNPITKFLQIFKTACRGDAWGMLHLSCKNVLVGTV